MNWMGIVGVVLLAAIMFGLMCCFRMSGLCSRAEVKAIQTKNRRQERFEVLFADGQPFHGDAPQVVRYRTKVPISGPEILCECILYPFGRASGELPEPKEQDQSESPQRLDQQ